MHNESQEGIRAVVGLGGNLGEVLASFGQALDLIGRTCELQDHSYVYATEPIGGPQQPDYLNAAILLATRLSPVALMEELLEVERVLGRERRQRWGPRVLDLDLLWISGVCVGAPGLTVPHPRLAERAFALLPLLDVAPDATHPATGQRYSQLPPELALQRVARVGAAPVPWRSPEPQA